MRTLWACVVANPITLEEKRFELTRNDLLVLTSLRCFPPYNYPDQQRHLALAECEGYLRFFPDQIDWDIALGNLRRAGFIGPRNGLKPPGLVASYCYPSVRSLMVALCSN